MSTTHYPLGTDPKELERLAFQHDVWGGVTRAFLDRVGVARGMRVLDLGCGPGFVTAELALRVGPSGEVLAVDESSSWIDHVERTIAEHGWKHVRARRARLQEVELETAHFDVVFARWVFSFVPDPAAVIARLVDLLKPGGSFAMQDYNHEGISLFPESAGFRAVVRATRAMYAKAGGDAFVAARAGAICAGAGLRLESLTPNVLCGGPASPAFRWAGAFFPFYSDKMLALGLLSSEEHAQFRSEWSARERDPAALFFSPIVVDVWAKKPS